MRARSNIRYRDWSGGDADTCNFPLLSHSDIRPKSRWLFRDAKRSEIDDPSQLPKPLENISFQD
jgi:hypothetical protein